LIVGNTVQAALRFDTAKIFVVPIVVVAARTCPSYNLEIVVKDIGNCQAAMRFCAAVLVKIAAMDEITLIVVGIGVFFVAVNVVIGTVAFWAWILK